ncbi:CxxC-x17-CxxC domain-containing protein [Patescibacteria group bacterium]
MADDDKVVAEEQPVTEPAEESAEEPVAEAPVETPAPVSEPTSPAASSGTDQQGRQLYDVKCAECGKDTQVPFQPSGTRPVYCRDCYMQKRGPRR